jgi:hypothetical protein
VAYCAKEHHLKRILLPVLLAAHMLALAGALQPGDPLPAITLKDQHEKPLVIAPDTKLVFFAAEMDSSRLMTNALATLPPTSLKDRNAVYLADISGMPGLVSSVFALPKMKKETYTVALIQVPKETASLPRKPGAVTVLRLEEGKISTVDFAQDVKQLHRHLK